MRYGMVINLRRCIGCDSCTLACKQANGTPKGVFWGHVHHYEEGEYPNAKGRHIPFLCMHCENAPCVQVCPTKASIKREDGIVYIDETKCIGCRQCMIACPFDARNFLAKTPEPYYGDKGLTPKEKIDYAKFGLGKVNKCNFCMDRVDQGELPACVAACPAEARIFGDLEDPDSNIAKLIRDNQTIQYGKEYGTNPSVYYIPGK
ncbi:MAG: 4Fe-4S dicluster domain-containing protein [Eubacteriales bacterium]